MAGGTRIVAFESASANGAADEIPSSEDQYEPAETADEWSIGDDEPSTRRSWLLPVLGFLAFMGWTAFFAWAMQARLIAGVTPEQGIALLRDWAVPVLLVVGAALVVLRNSRREALRFGDAARLLSDESARLEMRLSVVNRELSLAREFIAAQTRDLETLGRLAADRLSTEADRMQGIIRDNHVRVEAIGNVSEAALDNMEKLRGQLPVIASSAKDITNNIGNAGRTAHSQLQEMINGFKKLNEFGQASERQVHVLRSLVDETVGEFTRQTEQFGDIATARFSAFRETSAEFRTQMETHEIAALAAIRSRASAMAEELEQTRTLLDSNEAESLTSLRARLSALRDEGAAVSRALRDSESRALDGWQDGVTRMKEELGSALVALAEAETEATEASQARIGAIAEGLARLERHAEEQVTRFTAEIERRRAEAVAAEEAAIARLHTGMAALDEAAAKRLTRHDEIDKAATARLEDRLAALDGELALRRAQQEEIAQRAGERLRDHMAMFDADMAERRQQHEEQGAVLAAQASAIAVQLGEFERRVAQIAAHGSDAEATIGASLEALSGRLVASRTALSGTGREIANLTDGSVRLLELIQASVKHSTEELPNALMKGEARLSNIEARMQALRDAAEETDARGSHLAGTLDRADENLRRSFTELSALQETLHEAGSAYSVTLAGLRDDLDGLATRSAELAHKARNDLAGSLDALARSTQAAINAFGDRGASVVSVLARQMGQESGAAIEEAMRGSATEAAELLEQSVLKAAATGREAAMHLRDQLSKVNELAGNLESRVAHARARAEEQVDNDFTRRVALITESLNSNAIDIAKALSTDVADTAWAAYLRGDRGIFTRRAVNLIENVEAKAIVQIYERDRDFHDHVSRYIHDFEAMLRQVLSARDGQAMSVTLLSSDMGKLYVTLAQAIERLRN